MQFWLVRFPGRGVGAVVTCGKHGHPTIIRETFGVEQVEPTTPEHAHWLDCGCEDEDCYWLDTRECDVCVCRYYDIHGL